MSSEVKNIIIGILLVFIVLLTIGNDKLIARNDEIEEEQLELLVKIDDLEKEYSEVFALNSEYFDNSERMLETEEHFCCVLKGNQYYHKFYYCTGFATCIDNIFLIENAEALGYTPCPDCY